MHSLINSGCSLMVPSILGGNKHTFKIPDLWLNLVTQRYLDVPGIRSSFLFSVVIYLGYVPEKLTADDEGKPFFILCWGGVLILHFIHVHAFRAIFVPYYLLYLRSPFFYIDKQDLELSAAGHCAQKCRRAQVKPERAYESQRVGPRYWRWRESSTRRTSTKKPA